MGHVWSGKEVGRRWISEEEEMDPDCSYLHQDPIPVPSPLFLNICHQKQWCRSKETHLGKENVPQDKKTKIPLS